MTSVKSIKAKPLKRLHRRVALCEEGESHFGGAVAYRESRDMIPNLLSIAGFDPSGGAGAAADLKTFAALGCNGMAVVTALTAQNTQGVTALHVPPADFTAAQIDAVFRDIEVAAVKIGMLACGAIAEEVAERLAFYKPHFIVLDPVLAATSGDALSTSDTAQAIVRHLFPLDGGSYRLFSAPRVATRNTHGTGCTLSSAIAAYLAQGQELGEAIGAAKAYLSGALAAADQLSAGHGPGPVHHFHDMWKR